MGPRSTIILILFLIASAPSLVADPVYLTFLASEHGPLDKGQVTVRFDEVEGTVTEVLPVDTSNRPPAILQHPGGRRLYVFVYDFLFSSPENLVQARKNTEAFISKIPKEELIAIAGINGVDGLKMYCAPTADRNKVIAGLNWMGQKKVTGMLEGPEGNLYPENFSGSETPLALLPDATFLQNIRGYAIREKDQEKMRPVLLQGLADLGFLLSTINGRKHLLLFTPGTNTEGLSIHLPLRTAPPKRKPGAADQAPDVPHDDLDSITDTTMTKERMLSRAGEGGYKRKGQKQSGDTLADLIAATDTHVHVFHNGTQEHNLFKNLTTRSAGNFVTPEQDVASVIDKVLSSDRMFYVMKADVAVDKMKDLNNMRINVQGKDITASSKWLLPKIPANYTSMEKKAKIAENIYKDYGRPPAEYGFWSDFLLEQNGSRLPSFVQIDGPSLMQNKSEFVDLEFYGFSTAQDGSVLDFTYFVFSVDLTNKNLKEKLKSSGVKIWSVLLGNMQPATVNWTIMNLQTNELVDQSVPIDGIAPAMTMTQPFFPSLNLNWMVWPAPTSSTTKRGKEITYPYKEGKDMLFFPDISPVLKKSVDGQVFFLRVYNLPSAGKIPPVRVSLVDSSGKANEVKTLGLMQNPTPVEPSGMGLFWKLATLPNVPPGEYQLKITALDPARNQVIQREVKTKVQ